MKRLLMNFSVSAGLVAAFVMVQGCGPEKHPAQPGVQPLPDEQIDVQVLDDDAGRPAPRAAAGAKKGAPCVKAAAKTPPPPPIDIQSVVGATPYTVQKGDTLSAIGARYGVRWQDIVALNPGLNANRLRVGQVIQLPGQHAVPAPKASAGRTAGVKPVTPPKTTAPATAPSAPAPATAGVYVVKPGDVFSVIAAKHGVKRADLRAVNPQIKDVNRIRAGQKLNLPAGAKGAAAAKDATKPADKKGSPAPKAAAPKKTAPAAVTPPAVKEKKEEVKPAPAVEPAPSVKADAPEVKPQTAVEPKAVETVAPPTTQPYETYTVKEGEDVYAVAIRWGVSPSDLKALNNLTSNELKAGQVLKIPKTNAD